MAQESATNGKNQTKEEKILRRLNKREERLAWREKRREARLRYLERKAARPQSKEFFLVFWMLVSLTVLVIGIVGFPIFMKYVRKCTDVTEILEYSKWVLAALLAAFGAWIGAGAAYFFGKENLRESSRATEEALKIQQKTLGAKPEEKVFVKDLALTAMNPSFMFYSSSKLEDVLKKLKEKLGYWFVPIINAESGILEDIVSSQAFLHFKYKPEKMEGEKEKLEERIGDRDKEKLSEILKIMDTDVKLKKLHGVNTFFIKITLNDTLESVAERMETRDAAVAIVVDEKGKPTHCVTRTDIGSLLKPES
ncbi:hypothetical protein ES703_30839 [subsurface metagenome]|nr:CBS domain-containing protein [bacterium]